MFGEPLATCEHGDAGQEFWVYVVLVFVRQVLCVAELGHRDDIYLRGASASLLKKSAHNLALGRKHNALFPLSSQCLPVERTYRYTSIKFLYVNMLPLLMTLSHAVRRVLNNLPYHRRKLVQSLFRE